MEITHAKGHACCDRSGFCPVLSGPKVPLKRQAVEGHDAVEGADELTIYKAVLQHYSSKEAGNLHVSSTTAYPLNPETLPPAVSPDLIV